MGRMYSISVNEVPITAVRDIFQLEAAADKPIWIHTIEIGQHTDLGDSEAEGLNVELRNRITNAITDGGGEVAYEKGGAAFGGNVNTNQAEVNTGAVVPYNWAWNIALPLLFIPPPKCLIYIVPGDAVTLHLDVAPSDSITVSGTMVFEEMG